MKPLMVAIGSTVDALVHICRRDIPEIHKANDAAEFARDRRKQQIIKDGEKLLFMRLKHREKDRP